jgi:hypothetical protein
MLGFFTDPHPDELLYSVCSRYHQRTGNRGKESTARDLFGTGRAKIVIDFPSRLGYLVAHLPPGHRYTVERIIDEHTMLPYYEPFMPPERARQLRDDMCDGDLGGSIHGRIGILTSHIRLDFLRYCPTCVEEDVKKVGEPYWHRLHQAPGVEVCPEHAVFLERSSVHVVNRANNEAFITAKQALNDIKGVNVRFLDTEIADHRAFLRIAEDVSWLMRERVGPTELIILRRRYLSLLFDRGLMAGKRKVRSSELQVLFNEYYSSKLLETLHCSLERRFHWLRRLVQTSRGAHHPVHHLLLIQFLGCSAEMFFQMSTQIKIASRALSEKIIGQQSRCHKVKELSAEEREAKQATYRKQWQQTVEENPGAGRDTIANKIRTAYSWLIAYDREWFEEHAPARLKSPGPPPLNDWDKRDIEMAAEARTAYERLMSASGRPIRASRTAIAREMGQLGAVYKSADKLPLTNKALDELGESVEAYAIRRIWWAAERFREENVHANYWKLLTKAAVNYSVAKMPKVKAAFQAAVASLDPLNEPVPVNKSL